MGYTVKWVEEHLGITRKALRNYEEKKLMQADGSRNPINNYREYTDEDIERLWAIKVLQGIGFTVREIKDLSDNPDFDFLTVMESKIVDLERKRDEIQQYIEFAKTIKLTGRIPTVKSPGSTRFDDFISFARKHWNAYSDPEMKALVEASEFLDNQKPESPSQVSNEGLEILARFLDDKQISVFTISSYFQLLSKLRPLGHESEPVQATISLMYEYVKTEVLELGDQFTPQIFASHFASSFLEGEVATMQVKNYGADGCQFIAKAIAHFGGLELKDFEGGTL